MIQWVGFDPVCDAFCPHVTHHGLLHASTGPIPFWRGDGTKGVNLRRVFVQPTTFDLVLWVQGTNAAPYLEKGRLTDRNLWRRLSDIFRGQFIGFAIWFN